MELFIAQSSGYASLFTEFWPLLDKVNLSMQKVSYVILVASLISMVWGKLNVLDPLTYLKPLVTILALVAVISSWEEIAGEQGLLWSAGKSLGEDISSEAYVVLERKIQENIDKPLWQKFIDYFTMKGWRDALTNTLIYLSMIIAQVVMWLGGAFMIFFQGIAYGLGPLFISLLGLQSTRSIGVNFLLTCVGLALWYLAWSLVDLGTVNLATQALESYFLGGLAFLALSGWVIIGYILAPIVVVGAMRAGGNVGGALAGGAMKGVGAALGGAMAVKSLGVGGAAGAASSSGSKGSESPGKGEGDKGQSDTKIPGNGSNPGKDAQPVSDSKDNKTSSSSEKSASTPPPIPASASSGGSPSTSSPAAPASSQSQSAPPGLGGSQGGVKALSHPPETTPPLLSTPPRGAVRSSTAYTNQSKATIAALDDMERYL